MLDEAATMRQKEESERLGFMFAAAMSSKPKKAIPSVVRIKKRQRRPSHRPAWMGPGPPEEEE